MTSPTPNGQDSADRWLADQHHGLLDALNLILDPDAGLREATLHARHAGLLKTLGTTLDTKSGLGAILHPSVPEIVGAIAAADPAARMALRHDPVVLDAIISDVLVRTLTIADGIADYVASDPSFTRALGAVRDYLEPADGVALDVARARDLSLARMLGLVRAQRYDSDLDLDRASDDARHIAREVQRAVDFAKARERARRPDIADDFTRSMAWSLRKAPGLGYRLACGLSLARARAYDRRLAKVPDHRLAQDLGDLLSLARARAHARRAALTVTRALGITNGDRLAAALLEGVLDDFTRTDMTHTDLTGINLTGVRWSISGTKWPHWITTGWLLARSREVTPDSGIYVITHSGGGGGAKDRIPSRT